MVPLAMFVSTLISKASTASASRANAYTSLIHFLTIFASATLGFAVFLIGTMIQAFAGLVYDEDTHPAIIYIFSLFPPTPFAKGLAVRTKDNPCPHYLLALPTPLPV